jgi:hypothetical protein
LIHQNDESILSQHLKNQKNQQALYMEMSSLAKSDFGIVEFIIVVIFQKKQMEILLAEEANGNTSRT